MLQTLRSELLRYYSEARALPLGIAAAILGMYLPVATSRYALSDDYGRLWMAVSGKPSAFGNTNFAADATELRPVAGLLNEVMFRLAGDLDGLRFVRLFCLLGVVLLALFMHWALVRAQLAPAWAALMVVAMVATTPFQAIVPWALLWHVPYVASAAGVASLLTSAIAASPRRFEVRAFIPPVLVLLLAVLTNQPAAMFYWVFLAIALFSARHRGRLAIRNLWAHAIVGAAGLGAAFVLGRLIKSVAGADTVNASRSALTTDVIGKATWFIETPLYRALSLFRLETTPRLADAATILIVGGILFWLLRHVSRPLGYILGGAALIPLSFFPNLVVSENNNIALRTTVALVSLIVLFACFGLLALGSVAFEWARPRASERTIANARIGCMVAGVILVGVLAISAAKHVTSVVTQPQSIELGIMRSQLAAVPADATRIGFVQIGWYDGLTDWYSDELGLPATAQYWTGEPATYLILRELGRLPRGKELPVVQWIPAEAQYPAGIPIVDVRVDFRRLR